MEKKTLGEYLYEWGDQYDWTTVIKVIQAIQLGIGLGVWLDFAILIYIRL